MESKALQDEVERDEEWLLLKTEVTSDEQLCCDDSLSCEGLLHSDDVSDT